MSDKLLPDYSEEFDCLECGQHIVRIIAEPKVAKLCAHCIMIPGWFRDPRLRHIFAPEGLPNLPKGEETKEES